MESIGATLRAEREKRGLSLEDAHEHTRITVQNISALEEDRFDAFPNKVYARAFLRDYANFLGLDSAQLLTEYEENWSPKPPPETTRPSSCAWLWRALGYTFLVLIVAGALGAGGYFAWQKLQSERKSEARAVTVDADESEPEGAVIPKAPPVAPPKPEVAKAPAPAPKPEAPPVTPQYQTLEVATLAEVWLRVVVDGKTAFIGILPKGQTKTFQGKVIDIRSGKAGAVQLKLDGQLQPPLEGGSLKIPGSRRFAMPAAPPAAPPSAPNPAAAQPSGT